MPFNPATQPLQDPFRGWARGFAAMGQGLAQMEENRKRNARLSKVLEQQIVDLGIADKETVSTMGLNDKLALTESFFVKQASDRAQSQLAAQRLEQRLAQQNLRLARQADQAGRQFDTWLTAHPDAKFRETLQAGITTGLARTDPQGLARRIQILFPAESANEMAVETLGQKVDLGGGAGAYRATTKSLAPLPVTAAGPLRSVPTDTGQASGYLRTPEGRYIRDWGAAGTMDKDLAAALRVKLSRSKEQLGQLEELKKAGHWGGRITAEGEVRPPSMLANDTPIDELIGQAKAQIKSLEEQLGPTGAPRAPSQAEPASNPFMNDPRAQEILKRFQAGEEPYEEAVRKLLELK